MWGEQPGATGRRPHIYRRRQLYPQYVPTNNVCEQRRSYWLGMCQVPQSELPICSAAELLRCASLARGLCREVGAEDLTNSVHTNTQDTRPGFRCASDISTSPYYIFEPRQMLTVDGQAAASIARSCHIRRSLSCLVAFLRLGAASSFPACVTSVQKPWKSSRTVG